jgi:pilus assembly protein CpaB
MKNTRTWVMLGVAVVCGLLAVLLAAQWLTRQSSRGIERIVVAATDISLGQRLTSDLVKLVDWPASSTPPGAHKDITALDGRVLRTSLLRGEAVIDAKLAPLGTTGGLSAVIGEGRRAMTVRVNDVIGVAGFALPGNYVDILVNTQRDNDNDSVRDRQISKIVLERILVLAVAQDVGRDETKPRVVNAVTLEVTPEQAEKLDLARSVGSLSLVLRNQMDPQAASTEGAMKSSLLDERAVLPSQNKVANHSVSTTLNKKQSRQVVNAKKTAVATTEGQQTPETKAPPIATPAVNNADAVSEISKQVATTKAAEVSAVESNRIPEKKIEPVATPAANAAAPIPQLFCVGVINGLRNSTECY